jgi:glycosyltransferase involved in cell wall biosynthesis
MDGPSSLLPEALESDSGKVKLLVFGSMNARKNVLRIIQAVDLLGSKEYQLFIVGKAIEGYAQKIKEEVERNPEIDVILLNYFLPADEILSCFEMADIVLIPYVDFYGSSGILNTAIMYGKPVVCADVGLIPDIVNAYGIGVKVDPRDVKSIAKGIESAQRVDHRKISDYISSHQPSVFSKCLFYNEEN